MRCLPRTLEYLDPLSRLLIVIHKFLESVLLGVIKTVFRTSVTGAAHRAGSIALDNLVSSRFLLPLEGELGMNGVVYL